MNPRLADGPRPPESVAAPPEQRVNRLVPFVHVEDVERSIAFYYHLGFTIASAYKYRGRPVWAAKRRAGLSPSRKSCRNHTITGFMADSLMVARATAALRAPARCSAETAP